MNSSEQMLRSLKEHFSRLEDPRSDLNQHHSFLDILMISLCASICGAESFTDIEDFGHAKKDWLQTFLDLPNGIPSHDTFRRLFMLLCPKQFQECFLLWVQDIRQIIGKEQVAIDGKTLRSSHDKKRSKSPLHLVSAWATQNGLVLGQISTEEKSNEITAVPKLVKMLDLKGTVVSSDALNCQTETAKEIRLKEADYLLALKENQKGLYQEVGDLLVKALEKPEIFEVSRYETVDKKHGREEVRSYVSTSHIENLTRREEWKDLKSVVLVTRKRKVKEKTSEEFHFFITSLTGKAKDLAPYIREHWSIENQLHWRLDVLFHEDDCRVRSGNADVNLGILRHITLNLLQKEISRKISISRKRKICALDQDYLTKVLSL